MVLSACWGALWVVGGLALRVLLGPHADALPHPLVVGAVGTAIGLLFCGALAWRPSVLGNWSLRRSAALGALAGIAVSLVLAPVASFGVWLATAVALGLLGAESASLLVGLARRAPAPLREGVESAARQLEHVTSRPAPRALAGGAVRRGVTIIELIVLMSIVALLVLAFSRFAPGPAPRSLVEAAADRLNSALTAARTEAAAAGNLAVLIMPQRGDEGVGLAEDTLLAGHGALGRWLTVVVRDSGAVNTILPTTAPTGGAIDTTRGWEYLQEGVRFGSGSATRPPLPGLALLDGIKPVPDPIICGTLCGARSPSGNPGYEVVYLTHEEDPNAVAAVIISHAGPSFILRWSPSTQTWQ